MYNILPTTSFITRTNTMGSLCAHFMLLCVKTGTASLACVQKVAYSDIRHTDTATRSCIQKCKYKNFVFPYLRMHTVVTQL
jgi:hypothetical protein